MLKTKLQILLAVLVVGSAPFILTGLLEDKALLDTLPIIATVFLTACYVPQIIKIFRTKDVTGQSLLFWVLLNVALTSLLTNAYTIWDLYGTYGYLITEILNEGLALVVLSQVLYYRKKAQLSK